MSARKPFTKRDRQRLAQNRIGHRALCNWGSGNLPAPWAEGDVVYLSATTDRTEHMLNTYAVVTYGPSIDEGDAWYFRLTNTEGQDSGRLHVAYPGRVADGWPADGMDHMYGAVLVETADPEGLAERERLLSEGWSLVEEPCFACNGSGRQVRPPARPSPPADPQEPPTP